MSTNTAQPITENFDETLDRRIDETRRLVRQVDVSMSFLLLLTIVFGVTVAAILADHWLFTDGLSMPLRLGVFFALLVLVIFYVYRCIVPLFLHPINPVYAANLLEESAPSLKNSLINWILLRKERINKGEAAADKLAERMFDGVARTAVSSVNSIPTERAVDLRGLTYWGIALSLLFLFFVIYIAISPKSPITSFARIMLPFSGIERPQAVQFRNIEPGNTVALQGEKLTVSAELFGRNHENVYLFFSTDDGQAVRQAIPMSLPEGKTRYESPFPPGKQGFSSGINYWIAQGDSRSGTFRIDVRPTASIEVVSLKYQYPAYTGLQDEMVENSGDIRAVEGTDVKINVRSTLPLQRVDLVFDNDPAKAIGMSVFDSAKASVTIPLSLNSQSITPTTIRSFSFRATDSEGFESRRSGIFRLEVLPDKPPTIQWADTDAKLKDVAEFDLPLNGSMEFPIQAEDLDFGLRFLRFHVESGNKRIRPVELLESPATGPTEHKGSVTKKPVFSPISSRLSEGDTAEIWAEAVDTKFPEPNTAATRRITVRITAPQKQEQQKENEKKPDQNQSRDENQSRDHTEAGKQDKSQGENEKKNDEQKDDQTAEEQGDKSSSKPSEKPENGGEKGENQKSDDAKDGGKKEGEQGKDNQNNAQEETKDENQKPDNNQSPDHQSPDHQSRDHTGAENRDGNGAAGGNQKKPINPDTKPGDAMEEIIKQMKKDGRLDENNQEAGKPDAASKSDSEQNSGQESGSEKQNGEESKSGGSTPDDSKPDDSLAELPRNHSEDRANDKGASPSQKPEENAKPDGGDQQGNPNSEPAKRPEDKQGNQNPDGEKQDAPVDPTDQAPRQRDDSLDPNSRERRNQGSDPSDPKKSDVDDNQSRDHTEANKTEATQKRKDGGECHGQCKPGECEHCDSAKAGNKPSSKDGQSGKPSEGQPEQSDQQGESGEKPSGQLGEQGQQGKPDENQNGQPGKPGEKQSEQQGNQPGKPGEGQSGQQGNQPGKPGEGQSEQQGNQPGKPGEGQPGQPDQSPSNSGEANGGSKGDSKQPSGGQGGTSNFHVETPAEKANLEYTKKITNLVLEYLEDQLKEKPSQELLDNLGWTEKELRSFHQKWKEMSEQSIRPEAELADDEKWKEAFKSLGLKPVQDRQQLKKSQTGADENNATESQRFAPPPAVKERFKRYTEGIGK